MKRINLLYLLVLISSLSFAEVAQLSIISLNKTPVNQIIAYLVKETPLTSQVSPAEPIVIDQKDKSFLPYLAVSQKGQEISFYNYDDITHHIYSVSGKNRFSFKIRGEQRRTTNPLAYVGEVAMGCNIHDWMSGYVYVVDTPFYGLTNNQGKVSFNQLEKGAYKLTLWHPQLDLKDHKFEQRVIVSDNNIWEIQLPIALLPLPSQENQDEFDFLEDY